MWRFSSFSIVCQFSVAWVAASLSWLLSWVSRTLVPSVDGGQCVDQAVIVLGRVFGTGHGREVGYLETSRRVDRDDLALVLVALPVVFA